MADAQLGKRLRDLREEAGLSQEELASKAQVSRASIQNWEAARTAPRRAESRRLAAALGVTVDALKALTGKDRVDAQEVRDALQEVAKIEDPEEMRAALLELLARMPPAPESD